MEINEALNREIERRKTDKLVHFSNSGVSYTPQSHYYPIGLNPVEISDIADFRNQLERDIKTREGQRLIFWSYDSKEDLRNYDSIIDILKFRVSLTGQGNNQIGIVYYHTKSPSQFLSRFLPIASELLVLDGTWEPKSGESTKSLDEKIDRYLKENHRISYKEFKKGIDLSEVHGSYEHRPEFEARTDFVQVCNIFIGSLAVMNQIYETKIEDYSQMLKKVRILGIKREYHKEMLDYVLSVLMKRS